MTSIQMPQLGETIVEGTILKWLKAEGEQVELRDHPGSLPARLQATASGERIACQGMQFAHQKPVGRAGWAGGLGGQGRAATRR